MFIRYFIEILRPADEIEERVLASPAIWSAGPAHEAEKRGEQLLGDVGFVTAGGRVDKRVEVQFGQPLRFPSKTVLPMSWESAGLKPLFPRLDADIEVAPLGPERTQLSISARYAPPLGMLGRILDRALLHRVAEATVKDFLDRVGEAMRAGPGSIVMGTGDERRKR